jgi:biotin carboxyl carrier protein
LNKQEKLSQLALENGTYETRITKKFEKRMLYAKQDPRIVKAVIPGVIVEFQAKVGQKVKQGDTVMILEAMKMLNRIMAPVNGKVKAIHVQMNEKVSKGQILIEFE